MNIVRLLRRCHLPLVLLLGAFTPALFFLGRAYPQCIGWLPVFPAAYMLLAALLVSIPGRIRMPLFAAGCALLIGAGYLLFPDQPALFFLPLVGAAALFFALPYADRSPAAVSPFFYMVTLIAQFATIFLLHFSAEQNPALHRLILTFFAAYVLLLLLGFSRISLNNATLSRYRLPDIISRVCTVLTLGFFVLALALSSLPVVISFVYAAFHMLRRGIWQLLLFILNLFPAESTVGSSGAPMSMLSEALGSAHDKPSLIFVILEKVVVVFAALVILFGLILLIRLLIRLLLRLVRRLLNHLQRYAAAVTEDYEDEITDTRQDDTDRSISRIRRRRKPFRQEYPDTPAGEIRRSYARLLRSHSDWKPGSTARENLPGAAAALYERARYSDHPITHEDAGLFEQKTRRM